MITSSQISKLKEAIKSKSISDIQKLVSKWEQEIFLKESTKNDNIILELESLKGDIKHTVITKKINEHLAFHKNPYTNGYQLTHIDTKITVLSGNKRFNVVLAMEEILEWPHLNDLLNAMKEHKLKALSSFPEEVVNEYREFYNKAKGY